MERQTVKWTTEQTASTRCAGGHPPKTQKILNKRSEIDSPRTLENNWEAIIQIRQVHVLSQLCAWSYQGPPTCNEFTNCANLVCCYDSCCVLLVMGAWQHEVSKRYSRTKSLHWTTLLHMMQNSLYASTKKHDSNGRVACNFGTAFYIKHSVSME